MGWEDSEPAVLGPRVRRSILWGGHPVLRQRRRMDAEVDGAGPSAMVVEKDVVGPSPMHMVTEVGRYAQT